LTRQILQTHNTYIRRIQNTVNPKTQSGH